MADLQLSLLGMFQVSVDGKPVAGLTSAKLQALLAYLALEAGHAHARETLAELIWPERPPGVAAQNLRQALARLRKALPDTTSQPSLLLTTRETVQFNPEGAKALDTGAFVAALAAVRQHGHRRLERCVHCREQLTAAAALYRGDLLEGLDAASAPFEEWALVKREWLRREALQAFFLLGEARLAQGDVPGALAAARRQLRLDPWHEEAHRQVMRALAHGGQRNEALRQYRDLEHTLRAELGVAPAAESTQLFEAIRAGRLGPPASAGPGRHARLPRGGLPVIGRETELAAIDARLDDPACALLTLVGLGGTGKTTLAVEAARRRQAAYAHGVAFVPLAAVSAPGLLATTIGGALDVDSAGQPDPAAALISHLRGQDLLLVLDNFEHLLAGQPGSADAQPDLDFVHTVLERAPNVQVLVTSREVLNLRREWVLDVPGLAYPGTAGPDSQAGPETYAAVQLFAQNASRRQAGFRLEAESARLVGRISRLVEGNPLALELAAAWIRSHSLAQMAEALDRNLDFLATSAVDVPARHRSLRAVFEGSWGLLSRAEREALSRMAVFAGSFSTEAAADVAGVTAEVLAALLDRSLIRPAGPGRHELHAVLRQYAAEKLVEVAVAESATRDRHAAYFSGWVQRHAEALGGEAMADAAAALQIEIDNVRAAWDWSVARCDLAAIARSLVGLARFYVLKSLALEGAAAMGAAIEAVRARLEAGEPEPVSAALFEGQAAPQPVAAVLAALLIMHGRLLSRLTRTEAASAALEEGIRLAQAIGAKHTQALGYLFASVLAGARGDYAAARGQVEQALAQAQAAGLVKVEADALRQLGNLCTYQGDLRGSRHYYERCLPLERAAGHPRGMSATLSNLGSVCLAQGDMPAASDYFEQALVMHKKLDDQASLAQTLVNLGQLWEARGDYLQAQRCHEESLQITRAIGDRQHEPDALLHLGLAARGQGQYAAAQDYLESALSLYRNTDDRSGEASALEALGSLADAQGALGRAVEALEAALALRRTIDDRLGITSTLAALGQMAAERGRQAEARGQILEALDIASANQAMPLLLRAVTGAATLLTGTGRQARALELLACVIDHPATESQTRERARREWMAAAQALPEPAVSAAQARGRQLDAQALVAALPHELELFGN